MPQCAPTSVLERKGAATACLRSKQADINKRRCKSPNEAHRMEKDDESIAKPRVSLTYAPSLMAHVRRHHAAAMDANYENGKDLFLNMHNIVVVTF